MGKEDAGLICINFFYLSWQDSSAKLHYIFLYTFYCLSILTAHFIYINCLLFAWFELLSKRDFIDVDV